MGFPRRIRTKFFSKPGEPHQITFRASKPGRYSFRCSLTCGEFHPYMIGYLVISPNTNLYAGWPLIGILGMTSLLLIFIRRKRPDEEKLFGLIPLKWRFELTQFKPVRALFKSRWFPLVIIILNLFIFTIILVAGFTGGFSSGNYNFGIMVVWILWWVLLMLFLVSVIGRAWCNGVSLSVVRRLAPAGKTR